MIRLFVIMMLVLSVVPVSGGECANGNCRLRSRVINTTQEIVSVPVTVTRNTLDSARNVGRRVISKTRNVMR